MYPKTSFTPTDIKYMVKMSVKDNRFTKKDVENYVKKRAGEKRSVIRTMLRLEYKISDNKSELRRLDRYLRDIFDEKNRMSQKIIELQNKVQELEKYEWVAPYLHLSELLENESDYQMLYDLIDKLEKKKNQEAHDNMQKFAIEHPEEIKPHKK